MDLNVFVGSLVAVFVIIDPVGMALIFQALVSDSDPRRRRIAFKACTISALLLLSFGLFGEALLTSLSISIQALKISGGILLFYTAFKMVTSQLEFNREHLSSDVSVFPLSIPLLAGPGSLTVSILLFSSATSLPGIFSVALAIACIFLLTLVLMLFAAQVKRVIGMTGDEVLRRFLGVLLAALAAQFVIDGINAYF